MNLVFETLIYSLIVNRVNIIYSLISCASSITIYSKLSILIVCSSSSSLFLSLFKIKFYNFSVVINTINLEEVG